MARNDTPADPLALALAAGRSVADAAATAGVSVRTAWRRLADPAFAARVSALRTDMLRTAAGRLAGGMTAAADALTALLSDPDARVRLAAAGKLLELGVRVTETADLARRLDALERTPEGGTP